MAMSTLSASVSWIDPTSDNALVICFVFGVLEEASLHPISPFAIASVAVLALDWLEITQMLKHQYSCLILLGKLNNTSTHEMGYLLVYVADFVPEVDIVLLTLCDNASLASVACDPP